MDGRSAPHTRLVFDVTASEASSFRSRSRDRIALSLYCILRRGLRWVIWPCVSAILRASSTEIASRANYSIMCETGVSRWVFCEMHILLRWVAINFKRSTNTLDGVILRLNPPDIYYEHFWLSSTYNYFYYNYLKIICICYSYISCNYLLSFSSRSRQI